MFFLIELGKSIKSLPSCVGFDVRRCSSVVNELVLYYRRVGQAQINVVIFFFLLLEGGFWPLLFVRQTRREQWAMKILDMTCGKLFSPSCVYTQRATPLDHAILISIIGCDLLLLVGSLSILCQTTKMECQLVKSALLQIQVETKCSCPGYHFSTCVP